MLDPQFHYLNHENGKTVTSFFTEAYFNAVVTKRLLCEVIYHPVENKAVAERKQVKFAELGRYLKPVITIKQFLK